MDQIIELNTLNPQFFRDFVPEPVRIRNNRRLWISVGAWIIMAGSAIFISYQLAQRSSFMLLRQDKG